MSAAVLRRVITHLNKRSDARKAMQMIAGSHVIVAAVRVALVTARDPNDKARRLLLPIKINIGPDEGGFAFRIVAVEHAVCGSVPRIEWEAGRVLDVSADDALIDSTPRDLSAYAAAASLKGQATNRAKALERAKDIKSVISEATAAGQTSLHAIATFLNEREIPTPRGKLWTATAVKNAKALLAAQ